MRKPMTNAGLCLLLFFFLSAALQPAENIRMNVKSDILKEQRTILLHVPASAENQKRDLPLLLVLDAEDFFNLTVSMVENLSSAGRIPEMIVAGIVSKDRWRDFTPTLAGIPNGPDLPTSGGAPLFFRFIRDEVVPAIQKKTRLAPFRMVFGHSIAGLFAVQSVMCYPDYFSAAIATSPSLWWDSEIMKKKVGQKKTGASSQRRPLFISLGNEGPTMEKPVMNFIAALKLAAPDIPAPGFKKFPGVIHQTVPCYALAPALEFIFRAWPIPDGLMNRGLKAVRDHFFRLSGFMGYKLQVPETVVNRLGYMEMRKGNVEEAVRIFRYNADCYPASANVHDSLGEGLLKLGRKEQARESFRRALAINPQLENSRKMLKKTEAP